MSPPSPDFSWQTTKKLKAKARARVGRGTGHRGARNPTAEWRRRERIAARQALTGVLSQ